MGQVFRGFDKILRREVAIKILHDRYNVAEHPAMRGQFLKEARVGARLLHPNILNVLDLGVSGTGRLYFTMRLVDGASLGHCLDSVAKGAVTKLITFPLRKTVEALVSACLGVDHTHQESVLHLDLKPHNILVSGFSEVFVIDWGLARVGGTDDTEELVDLYRKVLSKTTAVDTGVGGEGVVGTPGYMSSEQALGRPADFGPTTDVYGLGGILHFVLYGTPPNQGTNVEEVMRASLQPKRRSKLRLGILPRVQRVRKEMHAALEGLEAICLKALHPEQGERYQTVEAMIIELKEWLASVSDQNLGL